MKNAEPKMKHDVHKTLGAVRTLMCTLLLMLCATGLTSCKEEDNTVEEFPNWQASNDAYFQQLYNEATAEVAAGNTGWKVLRNWSLPEDSERFTASAADHVVVRVLKDGQSTTPSPLYTDTVRVSYIGRVLPSKSYPEGKVFDNHMGDSFNEQTSITVDMAVASNVTGFITAIMNMHVGDYWRVYIPYQLGYDKNAIKDDNKNELAPAYSTLVFDIYLKGYYHPGGKLPSVQSKAFTGWIEE